MAGKRISRSLMLSAALALPLPALAAGLGKLTVFSGLGQPLRAEIEVVSLQRGEAESLAAKLASPEAYQQANIEYSPALQSIRFAVDRRPNNRYVINMTSAQPVNDPFLDILVELSWATGRLVREYTFLLDPQDYKGPQVATAPAESPRPAAAPAPAAAAPAATPEPPRQVAQAPKPAAQPAPQPAPPAAAAPAERPADGAAGGTYTVKPGDTLARIAGSNLPAGVTLQQMIVALFRANEGVFDGKNMNRLRAGRIITIPDGVAAQGLSSAEANRIIVTQAQQWNTYRQQVADAVAGAPARARPGAQAAEGRITAPRVDDAGRPTGDQLRIAQADAKGGPRAGKAARADDEVANARALREAQSRVGELEQINKRLNEALDLKNKQLAEMQQRLADSQAKPPAVKPEPPKPEPVKPPVAEVKPPPEPAKPPPELAKPEAEPPKPATPPELAKPEPPKPPVIAKPAPPKPPAPEPSLWDNVIGWITDNLLILGVAILAGAAFLGGLFMMRRRRATQIEDSLIGATTQGEASSVFGSTGGRSVDTGGTGVQTDFSQTGIGAIDTDEVDPVAEADVYMAYGRDAQAEEILKEALQKDPNRHGVRVKLLEIYAARKDLKAFETTAGELYAATGGIGPDWERAAGLGAQVDPTNPMYGAKRGAGAAVAAGAAAAAVGAAAASAMRPPAPDTEPDFKLGDVSQGAPSGVDFNVDSVMQSKAPVSDETVVSKAPDLGFDLNLGAPSEATEEPSFAPVGAVTRAPDMNIDFELSQGPMTTRGPASVAPSVDLGSINLDLGAPSQGGAPVDSRWQEVATKLDLAKAYHEMGDREGARELLSEVMKDGDAAQKQMAKKMMETIG